MTAFCLCAITFAVSINTGGLHLITRDWAKGSAYTALALASGAGAWLTMGEFAI